MQLLCSFVKNKDCFLLAPVLNLHVKVPINVSEVIFGCNEHQATFLYVSCGYIKGAKILQKEHENIA